MARWPNGQDMGLVMSDDDAGMLFFDTKLLFHTGERAVILSSWRFGVCWLYVGRCVSRVMSGLQVWHEDKLWWLVGCVMVGRSVVMVSRLCDGRLVVTVGRLCDGWSDSSSVVTVGRLCDGWSVVWWSVGCVMVGRLWQLVGYVMVGRLCDGWSVVWWLVETGADETTHQERQRATWSTQHSSARVGGCWCAWFGHGERERERCWGHREGWQAKGRREDRASFTSWGSIFWATSDSTST